MQPLRPELFARERFPVFNLEAEGDHFYGFPVHGVPGFKCGLYHHLREQGGADELDREPRREDEDRLRRSRSGPSPTGRDRRSR